MVLINNLSTMPLTLLYSIADIISTVAFDRTGEFLASGDRAGRVVLFQRNHSVTLLLLLIIY